MFFVDEVFNETPTRPLYHYTLHSGLLGIIKNKNIWASSIHYLNDASEFSHAVDLMKYEISVYQGKASTKMVDFLNKAEKALQDIRTTNLFVCSFSENGDLLSQWRGYCPNGKGYSIGFNYSHLTQPMKKQHFKLGKCIYKQNEQTSIISAILNDTVSRFNDTIGLYPNDKETQKLINNFVKKVIQVSPLIKNESFSEENEWRLISAPIATNDQRIKYREGKSMIIPYYDFQLADDGCNLDIEEIYIGPTMHYELAAMSLVTFLKAQNVGYKSIRSSKIPYRE